MTGLRRPEGRGPHARRVRGPRAASTRMVELRRAPTCRASRTCYVVDVAPQTGVRQTRMLEGEYVVTKDDVTQRLHFADSVARGRDYYTPYRALLPRGIDQLAGRRPALLGDLRRRRRFRAKFRPAWRWARRRASPRRWRCRPAPRPRGRRAGVAAAAARAGRRSRRPPAGRCAVRWTTVAGTRHEALPQPLSGVRVIDFTQVMMGPCATQMLGRLRRRRHQDRAARRRRSVAHVDPRRSRRASTTRCSAASTATSARSRSTCERRTARRSSTHARARGRRRGEQFPRRRDGAHGLRLRSAVASSIRASSMRVGTGFGTERAAMPTRAARTCSRRR